METNRIEEMEDGYTACKECGKPLPRVKKGGLETQKQIAAFAARTIGLCRYCCRAKFPEQRQRCAPVRWLNHGKWVDIRPLMSWWKDDEKNKFVRPDEKREVKISQGLLKEETED